ncbi:plexin-C1 [Bombina bombina]|uniref:plexin-C1 n=1 Tax=Bombina bombina TaxID=8345 RepID=UPI00235AFBDC|nr:plexin-C1 [Bombina bombina]
MPSSTILLITFQLLFVVMDCDTSGESYTFFNTVNNVAVGNDYVFVATENCLYQLNHTLHVQVVVSPREGNKNECTKNLQGRVVRDKKTVYHNKLLLVYNGTLLSCWNQNNGMCLERDLNNITNITGNSSHVAPCDPKYPMTAFFINKDTFSIEEDTLAVATYPCPSGIFSCNKSDNFPPECNAVSIKTRQDIKFVNANMYASLKDKILSFIDSFSLDKKLFFIYYPYGGHGVSIFTVEIIKKKMRFHNQVQLICQGRERKEVILSSFRFYTSQGYLLAGIFAYDNPATAARKTALCVFNITEISKQGKSCITDFFASNETCERKEIYPIKKEPILIHSNLTSVYAVEVQKGMVFFMGTGNGQMLKVLVDSEWNANCPEILYELKKETPVYQTILSDPQDSDYIYLTTVNEIRRIKVSSCEKFESCSQCLSSMDPFCVWCLSEQRCISQGQCTLNVSQTNWNGSFKNDGKCLDVHVIPIEDSKLKITAKDNTNVIAAQKSQCEVTNTGTGEVLCANNTESSSQFCSCQFSTSRLSNKDLLVTFKLQENKNIYISEYFQFQNCSFKNRCLDCLSNGCLWCNKEDKCMSPLKPCVDFALKNTCMNNDNNPSWTTGTSLTAGIQIESVIPQRISVLGKKEVSITGQNLQNLSRLILIGTSSCQPQVVNKFNLINNTHAIISLPPSRKETKSLCLNFNGTKCYQEIYYESTPWCSNIFPNTTWLSGGRRLSIQGKNMDFIDYLILSHPGIKNNHIDCITNRTHCHFLTPKFTEPNKYFNISITVEDQIAECDRVHYKENPVFTSFALFNDEDTDLELRIKKTHDELNIEENEIQVLINYANKSYQCVVKNITQNIDGSTVYCKAKKYTKDKIDQSKMKVMVTLGEFTVTLEAKEGKSSSLYILVVIPFLVAIVVLIACLVTKYKSNQMNEHLKKQVELMECEVRQEIRDGFAELQMDRIDCAVELYGTITFYDYRHFAQHILFPEGCTIDVTEELVDDIPLTFHKKIPETEDEPISSLKTLFENKRFLVKLIHILEKQNDFSIKDRCMFASFLAVTFQNNLVYLTELLEDLIKDLMEQSNNKHPKLMLRRTESVVEKLLTNWMSTVLYGFLRESVGESLYLLVNMLNQRIHKGPIDVITSKALNTLNEDWLLWQRTEFNNVELIVKFPSLSEEENQHISSEDINVTVLDCDTIGQTREKCLQAFKKKHGYDYAVPLSDLNLVFHHGQQYTDLLDVDASSVVMEGGIIKLNTIEHYKIENGTTINVIAKKNCDTPDPQNPNRFCHLVLPSSEENEIFQDVKNTGKHKFKVKELYLTKLLSTKVAIHSVVEKLFRSIWKLPNNKPPIAIKYFFDFLDAQAESKKITDPDVLHIWKTNSLPLRFWVNILKNPQFVFPIKKTAHLETCLSVIAQAFMDAFSLTDQLLGKAAPTNKLLYAKDIPLFKEEVKSFYKEIREAPQLLPSELKEFLTLESKKHEHEFKEDVALLELYKCIHKYDGVILSILEKESGFEAELKQLMNIRSFMENKKKCTWE